MEEMTLRIKRVQLLKPNAFERSLILQTLSLLSSIEIPNFNLKLPLFPSKSV